MQYKLEDTNITLNLFWYYICGIIYISEFVHGTL